MDIRIIQIEHESKRLDRWIKRHYPLLAHHIIHQWIRLGVIKVNKKKVRANYQLEEGDTFFCRNDLTLYEESQSASPVLCARKTDFIQSMILFEDETICVINKPYNLPTQGGTGIKESVDSLFRKYKQGNYRLVHRLDRYTTGVLLLAKTAAYATYLTSLFKQHLVKKSYFAITQGVPQMHEGMVDVPIKKNHFDKEKVCVDFLKGLRAQTYYKIIKQDECENKSLLECYPHTGRTHQIRVHLSYIGCPVWGDYKYGFIGKNQAKLHLHSRSLSFKEPGGKKIKFIAPLPVHFSSFCDGTV